MSDRAAQPVGSAVEEIEVTPEMIEAGAFALTSSLGGVEFSDWDDLAKSVFLAMCNPRESEPFLSSPRSRGASSCLRRTWSTPR